MRQLWCQDGSPAGGALQPFDTPLSSAATFHPAREESRPTLVSPLHPTMPQFSLTPLNIAEVSGARRN